MPKLPTSCSLQDPKSLSFCLPLLPFFFFSPPPLPFSLASCLARTGGCRCSCSTRFFHAYSAMFFFARPTSPKESFIFLTALVTSGAFCQTTNSPLSQRVLSVLHTTAVCLKEGACGPGVCRSSASRPVTVDIHGL